MLAMSRKVSPELAPAGGGWLPEAGAVGASGRGKAAAGATGTAARASQAFVSIVIRRHESPLTAHSCLPEVLTRLLAQYPFDIHGHRSLVIRHGKRPSAVKLPGVTASSLQHDSRC